MARQSGVPIAVRASIDLNCDPARAFALVVDELKLSLDAAGISLDSPPGKRVTESGREIGRIIQWESNQRMVIEWRPLDWQRTAATLGLYVDPTPAGSRVTVELQHWEQAVGDESELAGWFASEIAASMIRATTAGWFGDWITDRRARRPAGAQSRTNYSEPLYHYPSFRVLLQQLALTQDDCLLDVGCGGGAFIKEALVSGCRAVGIDHSSDMVRSAQQNNKEAVAEGRATIIQGDASLLPFRDGTFTCATMHGVLGFLTNPIAVLSEIRRVLRAEGRVVILGTDPELKGTPACPEPIASRLRYYRDDDLLSLGRNAGFLNAKVIRRNLTQLARQVGIPENQLFLFSGHDTRFLVASRS